MKIFLFLVIFSLVLPLATEALDVLSINGAADEEIISFPYLSDLEAQLILKERSIKPFRDIEDFKSRVPLDPLTLRMISPLLVFGVEKRPHPLFRLSLAGYVDKGWRKKIRGNFYSRWGSLKWKSSFNGRRIRVKGELGWKEGFEVEAGNFLPGPIAVLKGDRGSSLGPFRGEKYSHLVRTVLLSGEIGKEVLTLGLTGDSSGFAPFSGLRSKMGPINLSIWARRYEHLSLLVESKIDLDSSHLSLLYIPFGSGGIWFRLKKGSKSSAATLLFGIDKERGMPTPFAAYWRMNVPSLRSVFRVMRRDCFSLSEKLLIRGEDLALDMSFYYRDDDEEKRAQVRMKLSFDMGGMEVTQAIQVFYSPSSKEKLGFLMGLFLSSGPFSLQGTVTSERTGPPHFVGLPVADIELRSNSYTQALSFRSEDGRFSLTISRTGSLTETFWKLHSGLRMNF